MTLKIIIIGNKMKEVSSSTSEWTDITNLLSFVTNRRKPFGSGTRSQVEACAALILAGAEIERAILEGDSDLDASAKLSEAIRSSLTVSSLILGASYPKTKSATRPILMLEPMLRSAESLRKLVVRNLDFSVDTVNTLAKILGARSDLEVSLKLYQTKLAFDTRFIEALGKIHSLWRLEISNGINLSTKDFSNALRKDWRNLRTLTISNMELKAEGGNAIGNAIENIASRLRTLDLRGNHLCDSGIAGIVSGLLRGYSHAPGGALKKLNLSDNGIGSAGGAKVAQLVKANPHLVQIDISRNLFGSSGIALGKSLRACATTLRVLKLSESGLDAGSVITICRSLAISYSLTALNIFHICTCATVEMTRAIAHDLLSRTKSLKELDIAWCDIDGPAAKELAEGFARSSLLKVVHLSGNSGVGSEISALLEAMIHLKLKELQLSNCCIDDAGCRSVGKFIALSSSISSLDLAGNNFHAEGAKAISADVAQNGSLKRLYLNKNNIGDEGAKYVAEWVVGKVIGLNIASIGIGVEGVKAIAKAVADVAGKTALRIVVISQGNNTTTEMLGAIQNLEKLVKPYVQILYFG
ncbi:MAG: hypothetical protein P4L50_30405 [Anaerolineaceae bacterium]|nr:hypothetical protein [Anaerolineaceae bacterium]